MEDIQWYPGHMARARRKIAEKLKLVDAVITVVDARAPLSTRNPDFNDLFTGKTMVTVLNKSDLADPSLTEAWITALRREGGGAVPFSCMHDKPEKLTAAVEAACAPIVERYRAKGVNKTVRAIVAGIPNVGKSAILNRLAGRRTAMVGNKPGVTRGLQWVKIGPYLEMIDTPGMMYPKIDDQETAARIAILGSINEEILDIESLAFKLLAIVGKLRPEAIGERYGVDASGEPLQVYEDICRKRGYLLRGSEFDYERCAKAVIDEFRAGKLGRITLERP